MSLKKYSKRDIAIEVSKINNISIKKALVQTDSFFDIIKNMLIVDQEYIRIEIRNFGVFEVKPTKAKPKARNPRTNEEIFVPARKKTHFKPSKFLKNHLHNIS
tara:strand:- start:1627 stop:1935 length:309 start_codon:yes stop_codon:yes gene_type:complete